MNALLTSLLFKLSDTVSVDETDVSSVKFCVDISPRSAPAAGVRTIKLNISSSGGTERKFHSAMNVSFSGSMLFTCVKGNPDCLGVELKIESC